MVDLSIEARVLVITIRGWSKLWTMKRRIEIPLSDIEEAKPFAGAAKGWWKGWRIPGTHVPGLVVAGTYYRRGRREFWDIRKGNEAVQIALARGKYSRLVVDVGNPDSAVAMINQRIRGVA